MRGSSKAVNPFLFLAARAFSTDRGSYTPLM
jgi:hypothetical protein